MRWLLAATIFGCIEGLRRLSADQIATEMTEVDLEVYLETALTNPDNFLYLSQLMEGTDLTISDKLSYSCIHWDEDTYEAVDKFVNDYPRYRKYWLSSLCVHLLPVFLRTEVLSRDEVTFSHLPMRIKTEGEKNQLIRLLPHIDEIDAEGDFRFRMMNEMEMDWDLILADRLSIHLAPLHRIITTVQMWEMVERGVRVEELLLNYLSHQAVALQRFDHVQGMLYILLCWYDELRQAEGKKKSAISHFNSFHTQFRSALYVIRNYLTKGQDNMTEELIELVDTILVGIIDGISYTVPMVVMERIVHPEPSLESLKLAYYLARRFGDSTSFNIIIPKLRQFLLRPLSTKYEKLSLIETVAKSRNGIPLCQAIFQDTQIAVLMGSGMVKFMNDRIFGCLSVEQSIQYFRQWERRPLPNDLDERLVMDLHSPRGHPHVPAQSRKAVPSSVTLNVLIEHFHSLPAILPHRGKTVVKLVEWFWKRIFKMDQTLRITFEGDTKYLEIIERSQSPMRPIELILLRQAITAATLLRLHYDLPIVQLKESFVRSVVCGEQSESPLIDTLRKSKSLKKALSIAYNIAHCPRQY